MLTLDAYTRPIFESIDQVFEAIWSSPFGDYPFSQKLPILNQILVSVCYWIGNVHFVIGRINRDRSRAFELSIASSFAAPDS